MERDQRHIGEHFITFAVVIMLSASVSFVEVTRPSLQQIAGYLPFAQLKSKPKAQTQPKTNSSSQPQSQKSTSQPAVSPAAATAPAPAPAPAPSAQMATTNSFAHIRAGKGTNTAILADVEAGTQLQLRDDSDSLWQGIVYQGQPAYIYKQYLNY